MPIWTRIQHILISTGIFIKTITGIFISCEVGSFARVAAVRHRRLPGGRRHTAIVDSELEIEQHSLELIVPKRNGKM